MQGGALITVLAMAVWISQPLPAHDDTACVSAVERVKGNSLAGLIFDGAEVPAYPLTCRQPDLGDLLVFRTELGGTKYIKQIKGMPGQSLTIVERNHVEIDGFRVVLPNGRDLRLTRLQLLVINKIVGPLDGYFVIGVAGSLDSTQLGTIDPTFAIASVPLDALDR